MDDAKAVLLAAVTTLAAACAGALAGEALSRAAATPEPVPVSSNLREKGLAILAATPATPATSPAADPETLARGEKVYAKSCLTCHAANGTGVPHFGTNLTTSKLLLSADDTAIQSLIRAGRATSDPANTSGLPMPAKGGNPMMKDKQIEDVAAYVKSLAK